MNGRDCDLDLWILPLDADFASVGEGSVEDEEDMGVTRMKRRKYTRCCRILIGHAEFSKLTASIRL